MITWIYKFLGNYSVYCYGTVFQNIIDTIFVPVVALTHPFILPLENLYMLLQKCWTHNARSW